MAGEHQIVDAAAVCACYRALRPDGTQYRRHQSRGCARGAWVEAFGLTADAVHLAIGSSVGADATGPWRCHRGAFPAVAVGVLCAACGGCHGRPRGPLRGGTSASSPGNDLSWGGRHAQGEFAAHEEGGTP